MANLMVPEDPQFSEEIFELTPQTPAHADEFNSIHKKLFHNTLFLKIKNALLETEIAKAIAIALGRNQALVFNTYDEMVAWFEDAENAEKVAALVNGTNLYIIDKDVPDYWWSSVKQQYYELETQKVDLTKYDNIIGSTDISEFGDGTITGSIGEIYSDIDQLNADLYHISDLEKITEFIVTQNEATDVTLTFTLDKTPREVHFIPVEFIRVTLQLQNISISGNKVTVSISAYGTSTTNYTRVSGYLLYK